MEIYKIVLALPLFYDTIPIMVDDRTQRVGLKDSHEHPCLLANLKQKAEKKGYKRSKFATYVMRVLDQAVRLGLDKTVQPFRK